MNIHAKDRKTVTSVDIDIHLENEEEVSTFKDLLSLIRIGLYSNKVNSNTKLEQMYDKLHVAINGDN